ncbi:hypothetical protein BKA69DRAFT_1122001 [Paraphysoderma sedebokerense]|nr:hypothetical protein BKA69DRAFT_1122001 [Paraphysoderma sedebokerense]
MPPHPNAVAFHDGVSLLLGNWYALSMAVEQGFGDGKNIFPDDVEFVLEDVLNEEFHVLLDAGSAAETAREICDLYRDCVQGNHSRVEQLKQRYPKSVANLRTAQVAANDDSDDDSDDDNGLEGNTEEENLQEDLGEMQVEGTAAPMETDETGNNLDEDGWETVATSKKNRRR